MMENINSYLIPTACFLLLFLLATFLADRYRIQIQSFFEKHSWLSTKIPWKKVIKIGIAWVGILLLRKLIYYVPLEGVIQTKSSVWWVDFFILVVTYLVSVGVIFGPPLVRLLRRIEKSSKAGATLIKMLTFLLLILILNFFSRGNLTIERIFSAIITAPFLLLKMICTGKVIGLSTSLVLAYLIIQHHKKIITGIIKSYKHRKYRIHNEKFIITSVFILVVLGVYIFIKFPGHWEDRFQQKAQAAKSKRAVEDLLDAVNTINHKEQRSDVIGIIAVKILETGDRQWQKETFPEVIAAVEKIDSRNRKFKLLEKIAFTVAETGDIQWAKSVAERLPAFNKRTRELKKEILGKIERKND